MSPLTLHLFGPTVHPAYNWPSCIRANPLGAMTAPPVKIEALPGDGDSGFSDWKQIIWNWFVEDSLAKDQHIGDVLVATWGTHQGRFAEAG